MFSLFSSEQTRPVFWIISKPAGESFKKMWELGDKVGKKGSVFPYMKSLGLIFKSDLAATEHQSFHNFVHFMGALLGKKRSKRSILLDEFDLQDVTMATMCVLAKLGTVSGTIFEDKNKIEPPFIGSLLSQAVTDVGRPKDKPQKWRSYFGTTKGFEYVMSHLAASVSGWRDEWDGTIGKFMCEQYGRWRPDQDE